MATPSGSPPLAPTAPAETVLGPEGSVLMVMDGLGHQPDTGRLLRGLTPYLDDQGTVEVYVLANRKRREPWRKNDNAVEYQELVHWARDAEGGVFKGLCTTEKMLDPDAVAAQFRAGPGTLMEWAAAEMRAPIISTAEPLRLQALYVDKPWGREGWYTGIEDRGVCKVGSNHVGTELPYALGMFPLPLMGEGEPDLILLKTLEPRPEPVLGDLYLEVHEKKWETYLVLDVDRRAWPDGVGHLRAGLDEKTLNRYRKKYGGRKNGGKAEEELVGELREKINAYEEVRREIDSRLDKALKARGLPLDQPAAEEVMDEVAAALPAKLKKSESKLRAEAEAFIGIYPLRKGDVACLPPGVLHSLQHGVKVVEFQTPTYERLIAMFAQKVMTQNHWDTKKALEQMRKEAYNPPATMALLSDQRGVRMDRVVDFPQFHVVRTRLSPGKEFHPATAEGERKYQLLFVCEGSGRMIVEHKPEIPLRAGEAWLLPAAMANAAIHAGYRKGLTYLMGHPQPADQT